MSDYSQDRALAEFRGYWEPKKRKERTREVRDVMPSVMKELGLDDRLKETEVMDAWHEVVGDFIAQHASPDSLQNGVLYVKVLQPTVHYELDRVHKPRILQQMKKRFGRSTVRDIRFRLS